MLRVREHVSPTKYTLPNPTEFEVVLDKDELLYRISDGFLFGETIPLIEKPEAHMRKEAAGQPPMANANTTGRSFKRSRDACVIKKPNANLNLKAGLSAIKTAGGDKDAEANLVLHDKYSGKTVS